MVKARTIAFVVLALMMASCSTTDEGGGTMQGTSGTPPTIDFVRWTQAPGCSPGQGSVVDIEIMVTDPDTDPLDLIYNGSVSSCSGTIDSDMTSVLCPQLGTYNGTVTVSDPEGNSDTQLFSFGPCQSGQAP